MCNRKCVYFCSIIIILMVLSSNMNAKLYYYSKYSHLRFFIKQSDGLLLTVKKTGSLSREDTNLSSLSALVQKYISSPTYVLLNEILVSVSAQKNLYSRKLLEKNTSFIQNLSANESSRQTNPTLVHIISNSETGLTQDNASKLTQNKNRIAKLEVQNSMYISQRLFKPQIMLTESRGSCPVYTGKNVPPYVYQYRLSGSKYRQLLAGLALYNLGAISSNQSLYRYHKRYVPQPDEICKFGVRYENGSNDEMAIDCRAITHFILAEQSPSCNQAKKQEFQPSDLNKSVLQNSVSIVDSRNNRLVSQANQTDIPIGNNRNKDSSQDLSKTSDKIGVLRTNSDEVSRNLNTVVNATDPIFYGKPVNVTSKMECYVVGSKRSMNMKTAVPCEVLQKYTVRSISGNYSIMMKSLIMVALRFLFCHK